jgi:hypothetical protein
MNSPGFWKQTSSRCGVFGIALVALASAMTPGACAAFDARGGQFISFKKFGGFERVGANWKTEVVLTSPEIVAQIRWDEMIASWNAEMPKGTFMKIEARPIYASGPAKWYIMGLWSHEPERHPRESVPNQRDANGDVATDTLVLTRPAERLQFRITLGGEPFTKPTLKFLAVSLNDSKSNHPALASNRRAWGKTIDVPERSQMKFPDGKVLCSPTTVSMLMCYWARELKRPEIDRDVPQIANAVYDAQWKGTGNWSFNTAFAGSHAGVRAYVTRFSDVSELEDWISSGLPVALSLCYDRLRGKGPGPNGHLVVCVGFTESGDVIVNDPGTSENVRKIFSRKNLINAWKYSHNAVYLIYPENAEVPTDRFGHWDSWTARQRVRFVR